MHPIRTNLKRGRLPYGIRIYDQHNLWPQSRWSRFPLSIDSSHGRWRLSHSCGTVALPKSVLLNVGQRLHYHGCFQGAFLHNDTYVINLGASFPEPTSEKADSSTDESFTPSKEDVRWLQHNIMRAVHFHTGPEVKFSNHMVRESAQSES